MDKLSYADNPLGKFDMAMDAVGIAGKLVRSYFTTYEESLENPFHASFKGFESLSDHDATQLIESSLMILALWTSVLIDEEDAGSEVVIEYLMSKTLEKALETIHQ